MASIAAALFFAGIIISYFMDGAAGSYVGGFAFVAMMVSAYGFMVGMRSFTEKDVSPVLSITGAIGCGIIMVACLTLYLAGIR